MSKFILLDWDGCIAPGGGASIYPYDPLNDLVTIINNLSRNYEVVIVTGQPLPTAQRMAKFFDDRVSIAPEHSSIIHYKGTEYITVSKREIEKIMSQKEIFKRTIKLFGGVFDNRGIVTSINAFWEDRETFQKGIRFLTCKFRDLLPGAIFKVHPDDFSYQEECSYNILPPNSGKKNAIKFFSERGDILISAGDTVSDMCLLKGSVYPIVCKGVEKVNKKLETAFENRGYIAEDENGKGLINGLYAARDNGIISF